MTCRLCGSDSLTLAYSQGDRGEYRFYRCRECRLVNYDLGRGTDQLKYAHPEASPSDDASRANRGSTASYRYLSRRVSPPGNLLDIGCGNGRLIYLAARDGWDARGLELSPEFARRVEIATDRPVAALDFLDPAESIEGAPFDVVVLRHVLEHLPDTRQALGRIRSLLAPDGVALLEFPNIDAPELWLKRGLEARGIRRKQYGADYTPGHCNEFCRRSFEFAVGICGLRLLDWHTYSHRPLVSRTLGRLGLSSKARALVARA